MSDDKEAFKAKIKGIGFVNKQGTTRERVVLREDNGKIAGKQIDHWDGRVDAIAKAPQVVRVNKSEERYD